MKVTALRPFSHGAYRAAAGDDVDMPEAIAAELEKHGFVAQGGAKRAPKVENKAAPERADKARKAKGDEE